jgi:carboxylate-amine ligase
MRHAFGSSAPFTLGIEEELLLVDPETHRLAPVAQDVLPRVDLPATLVAHEAYAAQLELRTPICGDAAEALDALERARAAARAAGATLMGAGIHPAGEMGDAPLVAKDRYRRVEDDMRGLIRRTPEGALHVHLGMPDPEAAIRATNGLRGHLPLLQALAANSPFWFGMDSGLASARWALVRPYPGRGVPPWFADWDAYLEAVDAQVVAGGLRDYTHLWWDVRPHPNLGTVEVREMDAQTPAAHSAALGALVRALAREAVEGPAPPPDPPEPIAWSVFRAARDGLDAEILDGGSTRPARVVAAETLERVRGHAREAGDDDALDELRALVDAGGCPAAQRGAFARGGMAELLADLVRRTAGD